VVRQECSGPDRQPAAAGREAAGVRPPGSRAGCGLRQGTQALYLARAGHQVTGIDSSARCCPGLPGAGRRARRGSPPGHPHRSDGEHAPQLAAGPFDLVLCHGVLMYLARTGPCCARSRRWQRGRGDLAAGAQRPGPGHARRPAGNWPGALAHLIARTMSTGWAYPPARMRPRISTCHGTARLAAHRMVRVRVFTDHRDEPAPGADQLAPLLAAERAAGGRDPYRSVAALLHLVYGRVGT